jgi:hypothetical protein
MMATERGIIMSGHSVSMLLKDIKTNSRRVVKPQPAVDLSWVTEWGWTFFTPPGHISGRGSRTTHGPSEIFLRCPYALGQRLYVKETWCLVDDRPFDGDLWVDYKATPRYAASHPAGWENEPDSPDALKWRSPMFMPKKYARIWLEITGVRVEQLQAISEADAIAEGVWTASPDMSMSSVTKNHIGAYRKLWDELNGKRGFGWEMNPWVWVLESKRVNT